MGSRVLPVWPNGCNWLRGAGIACPPSRRRLAPDGTSSLRRSGGSDERIRKRRDREEHRGTIRAFALDLQPHPLSRPQQPQPRGVERRCREGQRRPVIEQHTARPAHRVKTLHRSLHAPSLRPRPSHDHQHPPRSRHRAPRQARGQAPHHSLTASPGPPPPHFALEAYGGGGLRDGRTISPRLPAAIRPSPPPRRPHHSEAVGTAPGETRRWSRRGPTET